MNLKKEDFLKKKMPKLMKQPTPMIHKAIYFLSPTAAVLQFPTITTGSIAKLSNMTSSTITGTGDMTNSAD